MIHLSDTVFRYERCLLKKMISTGSKLYQTSANREFIHYLAITIILYSHTYRAHEMPNLVQSRQRGTKEWLLLTSVWLPSLRLWLWPAWSQDWLLDSMPKPLPSTTVSTWVSIYTCTDIQNDLWWDRNVTVIVLHVLLTSTVRRQFGGEIPDYTDNYYGYLRYHC